MRHCACKITLLCTLIRNIQILDTRPQRDTGGQLRVLTERSNSESRESDPDPAAVQALEGGR